MGCIRLITGPKKIFENRCGDNSLMNKRVDHHINFCYLLEVSYVSHIQNEDIVPLVISNDRK